MEPYYSRDGITLYHADCREVLPTLSKVDLVLTDPPYGIAVNTDNSRFSGGTKGNIAKRGNGVGSCGGKPIANDDKPFEPEFLTRYGKHQIIWGWNNFPDKLPRGACLVWLKRNDDAFGTFLSDAETAWMSKGHGVYCIRDLSNNAIANERIHPTQKPVTLIEWCLSFFPAAQRVLDPFAGSCTTGVASWNQQREAILCEVDERYCELGAKRLDSLISQGRLFKPEPVKETQRSMFGDDSQ